MNWLKQAAATPAVDSGALALSRQTQLTKPPGSLGRLEQLAVQWAAWQDTHTPQVNTISVCIFAADHGIAAEGVSAFPQAVTAEMVKNFARGGAAVNVLARQVAASFEVVDVGLLQAIELPDVIDDRIATGTANSTRQPAMTPEQLADALAAGQRAVQRAIARRADLFIGGEMGIANTASATAIAAALLNAEAIELTGAGTGLNAEQIRHKAAVIDRTLRLHQAQLTAPLPILQHVGGFEIAALVGAYIAAAQQRLPSMIDGFICSVAALVAVRINPSVREWLLFGHRSQEQGHARILAELAAEPLLDLQLRLGEASGALLAVPIVQMACRLHNEMATFAEAQISSAPNSV